MNDNRDDVFVLGCITAILCVVVFIIFILLKTTVVPSLSWRWILFLLILLIACLIEIKISKEDDDE